MIGKIVKGTSFAGCVKYVLNEDKAKLLFQHRVSGTPEQIAEQFELQALLNEKVKNKVGHISLSFSADDNPKVKNDFWMLEFAIQYMNKMGITNTQFIIARHTDRDHPHCHIVYNRVDNDGHTISDKNDRYRNEIACKEIIKKNNLRLAQGKGRINFKRLRNHDKAKYYIYAVLKKEVPKALSLSDLRKALLRYGISTQFKVSSNGILQGVKFTFSGHTISGSKVDRQFSALNIKRQIEKNVASFSSRQSAANTAAAKSVAQKVVPVAKPAQPQQQPAPKVEKTSQSDGCSLGLGLFEIHHDNADELAEQALARRLQKKRKRGRGL